MGKFKKATNKQMFKCLENVDSFKEININIFGPERRISK